jgi:hypothetical protein
MSRNPRLDRKVYTFCVTALPALLTLLLASGSTWAGPVRPTSSRFEAILPSPIQNVTLYQAEQLPTQYTPPNFAVDRAASHRIVTYRQESPWDRKGQCSSTSISPDGYYIAALHCFNSCILHDGGDEPDKHAPWREVAGDIFIADYTAQMVDHKECPMQMDGNAEETVELVASGRGIADLGQPPYSPELIQKYRELERAGYDMGGDFVIFKRKNVSGAACAQVSWKEPAVGTALVSLGYPAATKRKDDLNSDGKSLIATTGNRTPGVASNCEIDIVMNGLPLEQIQEIWDIAGITSSTLDIVHGNSGGGIFQQSDGNLVGVDSSILAKDHETDFHAVPGSAYDVSTELIRKVLLSQGKTDADIARMFSCRK